MPSASNTARLEARISTDLHLLIKRAAEVQGRSITDFVIVAVQSEEHPDKAHKHCNVVLEFQKIISRGSPLVLLQANELVQLACLLGRRQGFLAFFDAFNLPSGPCPTGQYR